MCVLYGQITRCKVKTNMEEMNTEAEILEALFESWHCFGFYFLNVKARVDVINDVC